MHAKLVRPKRPSSEIRNDGVTLNTQAATTTKSPPPTTTTATATTQQNDLPKTSRGALNSKTIWMNEGNFTLRRHWDTPSVFHETQSILSDYFLLKSNELIQYMTECHGHQRNNCVFCSKNTQTQWQSIEPIGMNNECREQRSWVTFFFVNGIVVVCVRFRREGGYTIVLSLFTFTATNRKSTTMKYFRQTNSRQEWIVMKFDFVVSSCCHYYYWANYRICHCGISVQIVFCGARAPIVYSVWMQTHSHTITDTYPFDLKCRVKLFSLMIHSEQFSLFALFMFVVTFRNVICIEGQALGT